MDSMMTQFTAQVGFWVFFVTAIMSAGTYKLLTKQHSEQIKELSEKTEAQSRELGNKFDSMRTESKVEQATTRGNFERLEGTMTANFTRLDKSIHRIEQDTSTTREKTNDLSQAVARIQVKLESIENEGDRYKNAQQNHGVHAQ